MRSGVRHGCPLPGIIFTIRVDVLLRRLQSIIGPTDIARAHADDIAIVIQDFRTTSSGIAVAFDEFARKSARELNIAKTVFIPLLPHASNSNVHSLAREHCPSWNGIHIDNQGKLLGIYVGPGAGDISWCKPLRKFQERAHLWAGKKTWYAAQYLSFQYLHCNSARICNPAVHPVRRADCCNISCFPAVCAWSRHLVHSGRLRPFISFAR